MNCVVNVCSKTDEGKKQTSCAYHPMILGHSMPHEDWTHQSLVTFKSTSPAPTHSNPRSITKLVYEDQVCSLDSTYDC